ncbi:MAG TPA: hypothetical protein VGF07_04455, partial [Stellaceae bacterium]
IRIGLPMPKSGLQFEIRAVEDPYNCNTSRITGLTSPRTGTVSVYRRPLPAANLGFLTTFMWDGREPNLVSQAIDATLGHAQAKTAPTRAQQLQIVGFEGCSRADTPEICAAIPANAGTFTAQIFDNRAFFLDDTADGGPVDLPLQAAEFFVGINDPFGKNPKQTPFRPQVFSLFDMWSNLPGNSSRTAARKSIARGEALFNNTKIAISGVGGLNDVLGKETIQGFCGTCHDTPAVGNHSVAAPLNIGVADAGANRPPGLDISGLPVFAIWCKAGPLAGKLFEVTDPGRALVTGQCADIGKVKGPILRGLAARAPYFNNGSAATLRDVVEFYDRRFQLGFSNDEKADLVAFLNSL